MASTTDPNEIAQQARQRLETEVDARVEAVRRVAEAAREADEREQAARAAAAAHSAAWTAAQSAGWTDRDLRQIGLRAPAGAPASGGRRKSRPAADGDQEG
jgi:hypothetical protein